MNNTRFKNNLAKLESLIGKSKLSPEEKKLWKEMKVFWRQKKFLAVKITSCLPLGKLELKLISQKIASHLKIPYCLENIVNPEILGGLRIEIGETIFDESLKQKLESLKPWIKSSFTV